MTSCARDRHPILPPESADDSFERVGALRPAIEQRQAGGRQIVGDDQSGHAATAAEVEDRDSIGAVLLERPDEPASVLDHLGDRT